MRPFLVKSQMYIGRMSLDYKMLKMLWKKLSSCLWDFHKYLQVVEGRGLEFYCMVLQVLEKHFWQKPVLPRLKALFFQFLQQIWWASMLAKVKSSSSNCSQLLDRKSRVLYSLIRLTQCAETDQIMKIRLRDG
jgi:hypothetical protein